MFWRAFAWLEKAYEEHDPELTYIKVSPRFDLLRHEARLQPLVHRIGLSRRGRSSGFAGRSVADEGAGKAPQGVRATDPLKADWRIGSGWPVSTLRNLEVGESSPALPNADKISESCAQTLKQH